MRKTPVYLRARQPISTPRFCAHRIIGNRRLSRHALTIVTVTVILLPCIFALSCTAMKGGLLSPELKVSPKQALIGDPIHIAAVGLASGQSITLSIQGKDQFGNTWASTASFRADSAGMVDISRDAPTAGSYKGTDQSGLFWSLAPQNPGTMISPFPVIRTFTITLSASGQEIASQTVDRIGMIDLKREEVSGEVTGVFFMPSEITAPRPALIVLGGSEGGYNEGWAMVVASKTRLPTLALGYFGAKGLPPTLQNIPLETIERAMAWLSRQQNVASDRFGVIGASRGGELAILAASVFQQIEAVVGYTPSGVVWEGIGEGDTPAWTFQGRPFPYLRYMSDAEAERLFKEAKEKGTPYLDAPAFLYSLKMQVDRIPSATIPVEKSQAAFLLIGNPGDGVWPSDVLSRITIDRLKAHNHQRAFTLLSYDNGGHMLVPYPYYPTTLRQFYLPTVGVWEGLGGTPEGAATAAADSWPKVIEFLHRELRVK